MPPPCPDWCFPTCSASGVKVHLTSHPANLEMTGIFPLMHELCNKGISSSCRRIKYNPSICPEGMRNLVSHLFGRLFLHSGSPQLPAEPSHSLWSISISLSQLRPRSSQERALDREEEGRPEVQSLLKLKAQCCSNTLANEVLKKGRALKWGAKAVK